jgi:hypothetical protein
LCTFYDDACLWRNQSRCRKIADAIAALEQARAQKPFQLLNLGGERWLSEMKFARGARQMHFVGHS